MFNVLDLAISDRNFIFSLACLFIYLFIYLFIFFSERISAKNEGLLPSEFWPF